MAKTTRLRLTVQNVLTLEDGLYLDTDRAAPEQFYLLVRKGGKSRIFTMRYSFLGRQREKSYGPVRDKSGANRLKDAREEAKTDRAGLAKGKDPNPPKGAATDSANAEPAAPITVMDDCLTWYRHEQGTWAQSYRDTVMGWIEYDIKPLCGAKETTALTPRMLADLFYRVLPDGTDDPTCPWIYKNETCQRAIGILRRAIDHAISVDDHGRWKERINPVLGLSARLPKGKRPDPVSRRAVPYAAARAYYLRLQAETTEAESETQRMAAHCLLTMIETFAPRAAEVLNMTWGEIELHYKSFGAAWIIPAGKRGRMKNKRNDRTERDIPLLACTLERLNAIRPADAKDTDYVFRGRALNGKRLGHQQMRYLMKRFAAEFGIDATPHGWRTTAKSWGLDHAEDVKDAPAIELAQDRVTESAAGDRYRDTTLMLPRRRLAERFIAYLRSTEPLLVVDNDAAEAA